MRITVKDSPRPSFCNYSEVTIKLSEMEFEDILGMFVGICDSPGKLTEEFVSKIKSKYFPQILEATRKIDLKYKLK